MTVADLCADTGLRVQTVSTTMTKMERAGFARWDGKRRSRSTNTTGKVWFAA